MNDHLYTVNSAEKVSASNGAYVFEQIAGWVFPGPEAGPVPLYRAFNSSTEDHFYTANEAEYTHAVTSLGYSAEGATGYIYSEMEAGTTEFFRLFNAGLGKHFYTTSVAERNNAVNAGYATETSVGFVASSEGGGFKALFRSYKASNGDHFYTMSQAEHNQAIASFGYVDEGIACYLKPTSGSLRTPLFRCFHADTGDHFYTTNQAERDQVINTGGYVSEGIACYVLTSSGGTTDAVDLYRLYSSASDDHFYTTNQAERDNAVANLGYISEGTACFIHLNQTTDTVAFFRLFKQFDRFVSLNLIAVAGDTWTSDEWNALTNGFDGAAQLYRQVGIRLFQAGQFQIPASQAGGYPTIDEDDEASDLTHDWTVDNDAIDVFCVPVYVGPVAGLSPVNGPCNKNDSKRMNGAVVERITVLNVDIAHEVGHYLGLNHANDTTNIMNPVIDSNTIRFTTGQGSKMKGHCFIHSF